MTNNDILQIAMAHTGRILDSSYRLETSGEGKAQALDANTRAGLTAQAYFRGLLTPEPEKPVLGETEGA